MPRKAQNPYDVSGAQAVGQRLCLLREALGYTQAFIAKQADMTPQAWNNCERGADRIGLNAALRLTRALAHRHVDLLWIYEGRLDLMEPELREKIVRLRAGVKGAGAGSNPARRRAASEVPRSPDL